MSDYAFMKTGLVGEEIVPAVDADRLIGLLRVMVDQTWEIATRVVRHHGWRRPTVEVPDVHAALKYQARYFLANMERGAKFEDEAERSEAEDEIERSEIEAERSEAEAERSEAEAEDEIEWNEIEAERSEAEDEIERSEADEERSDDEIERSEDDEIERSEAEAERSEADEERSDDEAERSEAEAERSEAEAERSEIERSEIEEAERSEAEDERSEIDAPTCACDLCVAVHRATAEWPTWEPADEIEAFLKTSIDRFLAGQQKSPDASS